MRFAGADCEKIAIENPIGIMSSVYRKPNQIIHPWMFALGDDEKTEKQTCLWLKGLPNLKPTTTEKPNIEYVEWIAKDGRKKRQTMWYYQTRCSAADMRGKLASKTFPGIAKAMADQWGSGASVPVEESQLTF